jgi:hypothetical protein
MRVDRNAKTVSVVAGGVRVVAGCLGVWLAAKLQAGQEGARVIVFTVLFAAAAVIQGVVILSWDRRSKPMALMSPDWAHQFLPARCVAPTRRDAATIDIRHTPCQRTLCGYSEGKTAMKRSINQSVATTI